VFIFNKYNIIANAYTVLTIVGTMCYTVNFYFSFSNNLMSYLEEVTSIDRLSRTHS
jgi:hypothetical protein